MATSTIFNFNFNNSEIVDSTGQWYNATTGTPTTEFIEHDGNTALFQPANTANGTVITPNPTILQSYDPNFRSYAYTLEVQVCAVLYRTGNSYVVLKLYADSAKYIPIGLYYTGTRDGELHLFIDYHIGTNVGTEITLINFKTAGYNRWFSIRVERSVVDPNNPDTGATVKAYVDGTEVYNQTFTYAQEPRRGLIGPFLQYCDNDFAVGGIAIDNLKLTAGIAPSSVVDVSLANLQRNNANLLSYVHSKLAPVATTGSYNDLTDKPGASSIVFASDAQIDALTSEWSLS